jgi:thioredoxin reductase
MKRWIIIGAGPCGIASVGYLLDCMDVEVIWIDPFFEIGRMGKHYRHVPANTQL